MKEIKKYIRLSFDSISIVRKRKKEKSSDSANVICQLVESICIQVNRFEYYCTKMLVIHNMIDLIDVFQQRLIFLGKYDSTCKNNWIDTKTKSILSSKSTNNSTWCEYSSWRDSRHTRENEVQSIDYISSYFVYFFWFISVAKNIYYGHYWHCLFYFC